MAMINLFGAPGCGKSTTALGLTYLLKMMGLNAEYVGEYAKDLVYQNHKIELTDQFNIFSQQNNRLKVLESVDWVVTDSPLVFSAMYPNQHYPITQWESAEQEAFEQVVVSHFKRYPGLNVFINRAHKYIPHGRTQTEQEANVLGDQIKAFLHKHNIEYIEVVASPHVVNDILEVALTQELKKTIPALPTLPNLASKPSRKI